MLRNLVRGVKRNNFSARAEALVILHVILISTNFESLWLTLGNRVNNVNCELHAFTRSCARSRRRNTWILC